MAIPTYDQFIEPLLRFLGSKPQGVSTSEVYAALADSVSLTDDEREQLLPSRRQPVYQNRIGWAHDRLKRAGLSQSREHGTWQLTDAGQAFLAKHRNAIDDEEIEKIAKVPTDSRLTTDPDSSGPTAPQPMPSEVGSPDERIDQAIGELNDSVASELLDMIARSSPTFFEHLVLDLLHALGYGTSRTDLQRVGGSSDGGVDGVISLDRLGLEKVYVQAKRWQNNVGRPEIQGFFGALAGRRAKKGVFITTSAFTQEARDYASQVSDSIVLIDGARLARLMIEHGVGVTHRPLKIAQVDSDYFEDMP
ncbi:MAG: restriction endonuclease [Polyangiales bacterium]